MVGELAIYMLSIAKLRTQICNRHVSDNSTRKHVSDSMIDVLRMRHVFRKVNW